MKSLEECCLFYFTLHRIAHNIFQVIISWLFFLKYFGGVRKKRKNSFCAIFADTIAVNGKQTLRAKSNL